MIDVPGLQAPTETTWGLAHTAYSSDPRWALAVYPEAPEGRADRAVPPEPDLGADVPKDERLLRP